MKLILALLAATAIGAIVTFAAAAVGPYARTTFSHLADKASESADRGATILASDDGDEDHEYRKHGLVGDDGEDDDEDGAGAASNPAPAGTVAPPANGLFGNGPVPRVKVN